MLQFARVPKRYKMLVKNEIRSKNFKSCQVLKQKFYNVSDFELKFFTTRQILKQNFYDGSDFELKTLRRVRF